MKTFIVLALFISSVFGYADGPGSCTVPGAGMAAAPKDATNGGFTVSGLPSGDYVPGQSYTLTLKSAANTRFSGFIFYGESTTAAATVRGGAFTAGTNQQIVTMCNNFGTGSTIGHTAAFHTANGTTTTLTWVAPNPGKGPLSFKGVVVETYQTWYNLTPTTVTGPGSPSSASTLVVPVLAMIVLAMFF